MDNFPHYAFARALSTVLDMCYGTSRFVSSSVLCISCREDLSNRADFQEAWVRSCHLLMSDDALQVLAILYLPATG